MLHDNAVAQYIQEELQNDALRNGVTKLGRHCTIGEKILKNIPFHNDVSNVILYPHENADGSEPFGKQWNEVPFFARIIHMCDTIDIFCRSMKSDSDEWKRTEEFVIKSKDKLFDSFCVELFLMLFQMINAKKIGIATCVGLLKESRILADILRRHGFPLSFLL